MKGCFGPTGKGIPTGLGVHWAYMFIGTGTYTGTGTGTTRTLGKMSSGNKEVEYLTGLLSEQLSETSRSRLRAYSFGFRRRSSAFDRTRLCSAAAACRARLCSSGSSRAKKRAPPALCLDEGLCPLRWAERTRRSFQTKPEGTESLLGFFFFFQKNIRRTLLQAD